MALVTHKHMVDQMPVEELRSTFAAREHTLDYLVTSLRNQSRSKTLTSYLITGPRGAGKTTIVRMLCLAIEEDPELRAAWLPVRFPEELPGVVSLRDLLAAALEQLGQQGIAEAREAHAQVQAEADDEQSEARAIGALQRISEAQRRRLILLVENLDQLFERAVGDESAGRLRRLLMVDPFIMMVGTAVRQFEALQRYDQAFFNYFCPVPLGRLDDEQVRELLFRRAAFDGNAHFSVQYARHRAKIRVVTRLSGGNPRMVMMLYEILSHGDFSSALMTLRRMVDELTPLLKDILEHQLSDQQRQILDAVMRAGGTATPAAIARAIRTPLSSVTRQLQRLKEMQVLDLLGGGKGREAHYTVPDPLFCTWYRLRYLRPNARRFELFVDVLRIWFEEDDRLARVRDLATRAAGLSGQAALDVCTSLEYLGASLAGTSFDKEARELVVSTWLRAGHMDEAAMVLAEGIEIQTMDRPQYESKAFTELANWAMERDDLKAAVGAIRAAAERSPNDLVLQFQLGVALRLSGDHGQAFDCFDRVAQSSSSDIDLLARSLLNRGVSKGLLGDTQGAIADYSAIIELEGAPEDEVATALLIRGASKGLMGDMQGAIADLSAVIELERAPKDHVAKALFNRGASKGLLGDMPGAIADFSAVIELEGAPKDEVAIALLIRGTSKERLGDTQGAIADYSAVIELEGAPKDEVATALFNRGVRKGLLGDMPGAVADFSAVIELEGASKDEVAIALLIRGANKGLVGDMQGAITDCLAGVEMQEVAPEIRVSGLKAAFLFASMGHEQEAIDAVSRAAAAGLADAPLETKTEVLAGVLRALAAPGGRDLWPRVLRSLLVHLPADATHGIAFLQPVADVLESGDVTRLDPLPPEQREFALEVLRLLDQKEEAQTPSGPQAGDDAPGPPSAWAAVSSPSGEA